MSGEQATRITHVIFDLDGLLLDTERLYTTCTQAILERYGKNFDWEIKTRLMGRSPMEAARVLVEATGIPLSPEQFHSELYGSLESVFPNATLMPGAIAIVKHLHASGIPLAVATSSASSSYRLKVSRHEDLVACFGHVVCSDDSELKHSKPAPDIYLLAASRFSSPVQSHSNVLVFEDAPNGVTAGKAAGMRVVMVPDKKTEPESCQHADQVVSSLEEVDLAEWGLPPLHAAK